MRAKIGGFLRRVGWLTFIGFVAWVLLRMAWIWWLLVITQEW